MQSRTPPRELSSLKTFFIFFLSLQQIHQLDGKFSESESLLNHFEKNGKFYLLDLNTEKKQIATTWQQHVHNIVTLKF